MLNISKTIRDDDAVFALEGRLDTTTAQDLEHALQKAMPRVSKLTLDFENLDYISSAGLRVLLSAQKTMSAKDGEMKLLHVNQEVMDTLKITGMADVLTVEKG